MPQYILLANIKPYHGIPHPDSEEIEIMIFVTAPDEIAARRLAIARIQAAGKYITRFTDVRLHTK